MSYNKNIEREVPLWQRNLLLLTFRRNLIHFLLVKYLPYQQKKKDDNTNMDFLNNPSRADFEKKLKEFIKEHDK